MRSSVTANSNPTPSWPTSSGIIVWSLKRSGSNSDDIVVNISVVFLTPRLFLKGVLFVKEMVVRHVNKNLIKNNGQC
jgi:hypothetical protein